MATKNQAGASGQAAALPVDPAVDADLFTDPARSCLTDELKGYPLGALASELRCLLGSGLAVLEGVLVEPGTASEQVWGGVYLLRQALAMSDALNVAASAATGGKQ